MVGNGLTGEIRFESSQEVECPVGGGKYEHQVTSSKRPGRFIHNAGVTEDDPSCGIMWRWTGGAEAYLNGHISMAVPELFVVEATKINLERVTLSNVKGLELSSAEGVVLKDTGWHLKSANESWHPLAPSEQVLKPLPSTLLYAGTLVVSGRNYISNLRAFVDKFASIIGWFVVNKFYLSSQFASVAPNTTLHVEMLDIDLSYGRLGYWETEEVVGDNATYSAIWNKGTIQTRNSLVIAKQWILSDNSRWFVERRLEARANVSAVYGLLDVYYMHLHGRFLDIKADGVLHGRYSVEAILESANIAGQLKANQVVLNVTKMTIQGRLQAERLALTGSVLNIETNGKLIAQNVSWHCPQGSFIKGSLHASNVKAITGNLYMWGNFTSQDARLEGTYLSIGAGGRMQVSNKLIVNYHNPSIEGVLIGKNADFVAVRKIDVSGQISLEVAGLLSPIFLITGTAYLNQARIVCVAASETCPPSSDKYVDTSFRLENGTLVSKYLHFFFCDLLYICGAVQIEVLACSKCGTIEFCPEATGSIEVLASQAKNFTQNSQVAIGNLTLVAKYVKLLTEAKPEVQAAGIKMLDWNITATESFAYGGPLEAVNAGVLTLNLPGAFDVLHNIAAGSLLLSVKGKITNLASISAGMAMIDCMGFEDTSTASLTIEDRTTFVFHGHDIALHSRNLRSGSMNITDGGTLLCHGCLYAVRGTEPSFIRAVRVNVEPEYYRQLDEIDCGSGKATWPDKNCYTVLVVGTSCDHFSHFYNKYCKDQRHEYKNLGHISIAGHADLNVHEVKTDASLIFIKSVKWLHAAKQEIIARQIVRRTWCTGDTPDSGCGSTTTQIETLHAGIVGSMDGAIETIELDKGGTLVPAEYFKRDLNAIKVGTWTFDASSFSRLSCGDLPQAILTEMLNMALGTYAPAVEFFSSGPLVPYALGVALLQTCQEGTDQQQLECLQYEFLRNLVAHYDKYEKCKHKDFSSTHFDFANLDKLVHTAIYEQPGFHLVKIIFRYGSSRSMAMEFLQNALRQGPQVGAVPGVALTESQVSRLEEPIIWPVWIQGGISFDLYIPQECLLDGIAGAVFGGQHLDITVKNSIHIGISGQLLQVNTDIQTNVLAIEGSRKALSAEGGGFAIHYEDTEVQLDTAGNIMHVKVESGNVMSMGVVGGRFIMDVQNGDFASVGGSIEAVDQGVLLATNIKERPCFDDDARVVSVPKNMLDCTYQNGHCVLYRKAQQNIERTSLIAVGSGDSVTLAGGDIIDNTLHEARTVHEFEGRSTITRTEFTPYRHQEVATGRIIRVANFTYAARGIAAVANLGGVIAGREGTDMRAMTSLGEYYSRETRRHTFSKTTITTRASVTQTNLIELETGSSKYPLVVGDADSPTVIEGLISLGTNDGPNLVIRGGKGSALLAHMIPWFMETTIKRRGWLGGSVPRPRVKDANLLRNFDALKYKDGLGFTTGMISDAVSAYRTYGAVKNLDAFKGFASAAGVAGVVALFGDLVKAKASWGKEITVISSEGVTSVPNQIGGKGEGSFSLHIKGDYQVENTKVNVRHIDTMIAGKLVLKAGVSRTVNSMTYERESFDASISLASINFGASLSDASRNSVQTTHSATEFFAFEIMLVVDDSLRIEGALINGEKVEVESPEILAQNVLDTMSEESDFSSISMGIGIGWGGIAPNVHLGLGQGKRRSDLVRFISVITGGNVTLIARKITADLNQIVATHSLVINNQTVAAGAPPPPEWEPNPNNPQGSSSDTLWSVHAGFSMGMDGTITPSLHPSYMKDGIRTSAHISSDLFTGLKAIGSWMETAFKASPPQTLEPASKTFARQYQAKDKGTKAAAKSVDKEYSKLNLQDKKIADEYWYSTETILHEADFDANELPRTDDAPTHIRALRIAAEHLRALGQKYTELEQEHPNMAQFGLSALNLAVQTLTGGLPGLANAARAELVGLGAAALTASTVAGILHKANDATYAFIKKHTPELSDLDARTFATAATLGAAMVASGAAQAKHVLHSLANLKASTAFRFSTAGIKPGNAHAMSQHTFTKPSAAGPASTKVETASTKPKLKRVANPTKADSPVWKEFSPYKGKTKTNGLNGRHREYYEWDHTHNDIEVFDHKFEHLGSMDPRNGNMYKPAKGHEPTLKR